MSGRWSVDPDKRDGREFNEIANLLVAAGKYPLLTKDQEYVIIRRCQDAMVVEADPDTKVDQYRAAVKAHQEACQTMSLHNLRLVIDIAKKFRGRGISLSELVSEGVDGLFRGVEKFQMSTGNKFSTYATWWIRQRMFKAVRNKSRLVKLKEADTVLVTKLKKLFAAWSGRFGEDPTPQDLSNEFKLVYGETVTPEKCRELGKFDYDMLWMDSPVSSEEDAPSAGSFLSSGEKYEPEAVLENGADRETFETQVLPLLSQEDQDFMRMKWGLGFVDQKVRTDREMSVLLGKTIKQVKDWEKRIVQFIKNEVSVNCMTESRLVGVHLVSVGSQQNRVIDVLKRLTKLTSLQILTVFKDVPACIASKMEHDLADELVCELTAAGAGVTIV